MAGGFLPRLVVAGAWLFAASATGAQTNKGVPVNMHLITQPLVRQAVQAMNDNDRAAWMALFSADAMVTDDGKPHDFTDWSDTEVFAKKRAYLVLGKSRGYFTAIDRVTNEGTLIYGKFHSDRWGELDVYSRFHVRDGKIVRLDVGQVKN
jgi:hypothetical protein